MMNDLLAALAQSSGVDVETLQSVGSLGGLLIGIAYVLLGAFRGAVLATNEGKRLWKWATTKPPKPVLPMQDLAITILQQLNCGGWKEDSVGGHDTIVKEPVRCYLSGDIYVAGKKVRKLLAEHEQKRIDEATAQKRAELKHAQAEAEKLAALDALTAPRKK